MFGRSSNCRRIGWSPPLRCGVLVGFACLVLFGALHVTRPSVRASELARQVSTGDSQSV